MGDYSFQGIAFLLITTLTAMQGAYVCTPIALFLALPRILGLPMSAIFYKLFVFWTNMVAGTWFALVGLMIEVLHGARVSYLLRDANGNVLKDLRAREFLKPPPPGKVNILIMNHRTRLDWMLLWSFLARTDLLPTLKIVLKAELAGLPFFGWTMQAFRFLFLQRKKEEDEDHIRDLMKNLATNRERATFLIFPEGSDLSQSNVQKSQAFAEKQGLPKFHQVLNPRTTGLLVMKNAIGAENIHEVLDLTIGYTDFVQHERPEGKALITGRMPRQLHFACRRYAFEGSSPSLKESPALVAPVKFEDAAFASWVEDRFKEKEVALTEFYANNPVDFEPAGSQRVGSSKYAEKLSEAGVMNFLVYPLVFWILPTLASLLRLFEFHVLTIFWVVLVSAFFGWVSKHGRLDMLLLKAETAARKALRKTK